VVGTITVGRRPRGLALSRDGSRLYVAADGVAVVDTRALKVLEHLQPGSDPVDLALARGERQLFVANENASAVSVVDVRDGRLIKRIPVARKPQAVRISPNGEWVAVVSNLDPLVTLIDSHLLESVRTTSLGTRPVGLVFASDGREAYVVDTRDAGVYRIGMPSSTPGAPVRAASVGRLVQLPRIGRPIGIVLDSSRRRLYVSAGSSDAVSVVAVDGGRLIQEVRVGAHPRGLALTPDDRLLFTANTASNDVSVVDTTTLRSVARIAVGRSPWSVIVEP
jgi:YVTN family beta-propeller protein